MRKAMSPAELGFNRYDAPRLKKALKSTCDKRTFQRVQAVLLVAQGRTIYEVAEIAGVSQQTIYNWLSRYLDRHQVTALEEAPRMTRTKSPKSAKILIFTKRLSASAIALNRYVLLNMQESAIDNLMAATVG